MVPASEDKAVRIELFGDEVNAIAIVDALTGETIEQREYAALFPLRPMSQVMNRLNGPVMVSLPSWRARSRPTTNEKLVEAHRLETRTKYDVEMIKEVGFCPGIRTTRAIWTSEKGGSRGRCSTTYQMTICSSSTSRT